MKENNDDSININVKEQNVPYKRERPTFKQNNKRKNNYYKNVLDEPDTSALIELSTKNSSSPNKNNLLKRKSKTFHKKQSLTDEKYTEKLILENKKKLTRLTNKTYYTRTNDKGTLSVFEKDTNIEVPNNSKPSKKQIIRQALIDLGGDGNNNYTLYQLEDRLEKKILGN